MYIPIYKSTYD